MESITITDPGTGEEITLFVLEHTRIRGVSYLLAAEEEEGDSLAYILKEVQTEEDDIIYEMVEDGVEMDAMIRVFAEMLDDVDFES